MAFSAGGDSGGPMAEINVTPLVDVMLVLLIIFMITAPLMSHKVKVVLPEAMLEDSSDKADRPVTIAIQENGDIYLNDEAVDMDTLRSKLAVEAQKKPQPQVDVRADATTRYRIVQSAVKTAKEVGIRRVGFVATPER